MRITEGRAKRRLAFQIGRVLQPYRQQRKAELQSLRAKVLRDVEALWVPVRLRQAAELHRLRAQCAAS